MKKERDVQPALTDKLNFLLSKVELSESECRWLLDYLKNTDGPELRDIMYHAFCASGDPLVSYGDFCKTTLEKIHKKIDSR